MGCTFSQSFVGQKWIKAVMQTCWHYSRLGQIPACAVVSALGHISFALCLVKQRNGPGDRGGTFLMWLRMAWQWGWQSRKSARSADGDDGCACRFTDSCGWVGHSSTHFFQSEKVMVSTWVLCTAFVISSPVQSQEGTILEL